MVLFFIAMANPLIHSQKLNDTLKISEIEIYSKRPLRYTGLTRTKLDSMVLLEKANVSLAEVLSEHSSIFIKTYGMGAMASASFRGTAPSHTKVTWNGIELNSPMLGMVDFSLLPMFLIDNVELLHGSSSISRTTGALGGLISLSTEPNWNKGISGSYLQGLGSFGSYDEYLRINTGNKQIQTQTRIFYTHSENDYKYLNTDIIDSVNLETGKKYHPEMRNKDAWFTNYGFVQELNFRPTKKDFLSLSLWGQESTRSIPQLSTNEAGLNNNINREENTTFRGVLSYKHYSGQGQFKFLTGLNFMDMDYTLQNRLQEGTLLTELNSISQTSSLYNHFEYSFEMNSKTRMEFTGDLNIHKVHSIENVQQFGYEKKRLQSSLSATMINKWDKRWRSNITFASGMVGEKTIPLIYNTGVEYHILPEDRLFLHMSVAGNSRYPSLNDLYFQPGGNPSLKPEKSFNQELGLNYKGNGHALALEYEISAFTSQVKDWILWLPTFKGYWVPGNIKEVRIKGLETNISLSGNIGVTHYKINGNYALTSSVKSGKNINPGDESYGKQLPFIPVHSANCIMNFMYKTWSFSYLWNYYSERYTTTSNYHGSIRDYLYPYYLSQAGLSKQLNIRTIRVDLNFKVHNIFNEKYRSVLQRPMPGRSFNLYAKIAF
jgi:outer membrane cobalamin receptor